MGKPLEKIIILQSIENPLKLEPYVSLSYVCDLKGWKFNTLSRKKMPFEHDGFRVDKLDIIRKK